VRSVERSVSEKLVPSIVSEAVRANQPRPGFSDELLSALRDVPPLVGVPDDPDDPLDRWMLPGLIVGTVCGAGLLFFELGRRSKEGWPAARVITRRFR
jgi:hypothetical protein